MFSFLIRMKYWWFNMNYNILLLLIKQNIIINISWDRIFCDTLFSVWKLFNFKTNSLLNLESFYSLLITEVIINFKLLTFPPPLYILSYFFQRFFFIFSFFYFQNYFFQEFICQWSLDDYIKTCLNCFFLYFRIYICWTSYH